MYIWWSNLMCKKAKNLCSVSLFLSHSKKIVMTSKKLKDKKMPSVLWNTWMWSWEILKTNVERNPELLLFLILICLLLRFKATAITSFPNWGSYCLLLCSFNLFSLRGSFFHLYLLKDNPDHYVKNKQSGVKLKSITFIELYLRSVHYEFSIGSCSLFYGHNLLFSVTHIMHWACM